MPTNGSPSKFLSRDERIARGKAARTVAPRSAQGDLGARRKRDPIALLIEQGKTRLKPLLPLRYERMASSPFAFLRGAAIVMAADLSRSPTSGIETQLCGDAHVSNFGLFGTPERKLVFDINDFDETHPGPWEWDVKRLVASLEVAGRERGFSRTERRDSILQATRAYREALAEFATERNLEVWYAMMDASEVESRYEDRLSRRLRDQSMATIARAQERDSVRAFKKLTELVDGQPRIAHRPPLIVPLRDLVEPQIEPKVLRAIAGLVGRYSESLDGPRQVLLRQYKLVDVAHKVVGVGSVGTRCWIALFLGVDGEDPLFLQVKEARASVLAPYVRTRLRMCAGERVVTGQRLMQSQSDILLGWARGLDVTGRHIEYYVRQLQDWKGSFPVDELSPSAMAIYGEMCAWTLARAHARAGDRVAIAAYLGRSDAFDQAMVNFARAYADQTERDHASLREAMRTGRVSMIGEPAAAVVSHAQLDRLH